MKNENTLPLVIGIGHAGNTVLHYLLNENFPANFLCLDTRLIDLAMHSSIQNRLLIKGSNKNNVYTLEDQSITDVKSFLEKTTSKTAIIVAGLGKKAGSLCTPLIAELCHKASMFTIVIVTSPFQYEGSALKHNALLALEALQVKTFEGHVDMTIVLSQENLRMQHGNMPFEKLFRVTDTVIARTIECIVLHEATIRDKANLEKIAVFSWVIVTGENAAKYAAEQLLTTPTLCDYSMENLAYVLVNIIGNNISTEEQKIIETDLKSSLGHSPLAISISHDESRGTDIELVLIALLHKTK